MRRYNVEKPYEKLKALTRGQAMTRDMMVSFVNGNELEAVPAADRARLAEMTLQLIQVMLLTRQNKLKT